MILISADAALELGEALIDAHYKAQEEQASIGLIRAGERVISTARFDEGEAFLIVLDK